MKENDKKTSYQAPALDKGLDILEYIGAQSSPKTQGEIAQDLGKNPSEIYRMLACLEARGYLLKQNGAYRLSLRLYQVGREQLGLVDLRSAARAPMEKLCEATGQSCHISVQHAGGLLVLFERMPRRKLSLAVGEGSTYPLWRTASGKVALGRLSTEERDLLLEQDEGFTQLPPAFQERARLVIEKAQEDGYLAQVSDFTEGVSDIAMPIGLDDEDASAVLALTCFESGINDVEGVEYLALVREAAQSIDLALGIVS